MSGNLNHTFKQKLGLGVGLDMQWGHSSGFVYEEKNQTWSVPAATRNFFERYKSYFDYSFASLQPKPGFGLLPDAYIGGLKEFYNLLPAGTTHALHHTFLNLASPDVYDRGPLYDFTNKITTALNLKWINEDIGIWALKGKSLPYPLPPILNRYGLDLTITNVLDANSRLEAPLLLEFPGFTEGASFSIGTMHAYDFFYELTNQTGNGMTLDIGHILGYQWLLGKRGSELFEDLERLPLDSVFEIHLSGCGIINDKFHDFHHGVILDEQLDLLEIVLPRCRNAKAITYEDPRFLANGTLIKGARKNFDRLVSLVNAWKENDNGVQYRGHIDSADFRQQV